LETVSETFLCLIADIPPTKKRITGIIPGMFVAKSMIAPKPSKTYPIVLTSFITNTITIALIETTIEIIVEYTVKFSIRSISKLASHDIKIHPNSMPYRMIGTTTIPNIPPIRVRV